MVAFGAVGELAGQHARLEKALALDEVARLACSLARPRGGERLLDDPPPLRRTLLEVLREAFRERQRNVTLDLGVAQVALGLAFELRLEHLDADHRGKALPHVLAGEVGVLLLEDSRLARIAVEHVGQRGAKSGQVGAALDRVDRVGERDHVFDERIVVLERDLDLGALDLTVDVEGRDVDHRLVAVQGAHEGDDAAVEIEGAGVAEGLVSQSDLQPLVEVRHLAQAVLDDLAVEFGVGEDLGVGPEPNDGAGAVGLADGLDPGAGHTTLVLLLVDLAAPVHPNLEPLAEEVDGGNPDTVESRRDLVSAATELAARVDPGAGAWCLGGWLPPARRWGCGAGPPAREAFSYPPLRMRPARARRACLWRARPVFWPSQRGELMGVNWAELQVLNSTGF